MNGLGNLQSVHKIQWQLWICILCLSIVVCGQKDSIDTRTGHTATINQVAFSPDGKFLASTSDDHTIQIWEIKSGKVLLKIDASDSNQAIAFSPDGKIIASTGGAGVKLWEAKTGKEIESSEENSLDFYGATSVVFSPDGTLIAATNDEEVVVWEVATKEESYRLEKAKSPIAFNKSGTLLATASGDDLIKIWDVSSGSKIRTIEGAGKVLALAFNPKGKTIVSIGTNSDDKNEIKTWSVAKGEQVEEFSPEIEPHGGFAFTPDGSGIIVADEANYTIAIKLLDAETGAEQDTYEAASTGFGKAFALSPDGQILAFSDDSGLNISVFNLEAREEIAALKGHSISVISLVFSRDGKTLIGVYKDGSIIHWDAASGQLKKHISVKESNRSFSEGLVFNADGSILAMDNYNQILFFDTGTGTAVSADDLPETYSRSLAFSSDSKTLAAGDLQSITLCEVSTGKIVQKYSLPTPSKNSTNIIPADGDYSFPVPVFGKDGKTIVGITKHGITYWNLATGKILRAIKKEFGDVNITNAAFNSDGKLLVISSTYPKTITVINAVTGATAYVLDNRDSKFDISSDGKILASSVWLEDLTLTNLANGKTLRTIKLDNEKYSLSMIRQSRDNSILAVGSDDGITLYKTATGEKIRSMQ